MSTRERVPRLPADLLPLALGTPWCLVALGCVYFVIGLWLLSYTPMPRVSLASVLLGLVAWATLVSTIRVRTGSLMHRWLWQRTSGSSRTRVFPIVGDIRFCKAMSLVLPASILAGAYSRDVAGVILILAPLIVLVAWLSWLRSAPRFITCRRGRIARIQQERNRRTGIVHWKWDYIGVATPMYTRLWLGIDAGSWPHLRRYSLVDVFFAGQFVERVGTDPMVIAAHEAKAVNRVL